MMSGQKLSVLVISPDPGVHGGVTVFAEMLKAHFTRSKATSLWVGSVQGRRESILKRTWRVVAMPFIVIKLVKRQDVDVVHINPSFTYQSVLRDGAILLMLRLIGFRHVLVYIHGWEVPLEKLFLRRVWLGRLFAWLLNGTGHVMVLAPEFKTALEQMGVKPGHVTFTRTMFDGVELNKGALSIVPARRSVLFMSRFIKEKGVYELLEAFARLAKAFSDVDLILAGDGPEYAGLREKTMAFGLNGRVFFPGYVHGVEKSQLLHSCTLYTLPTYLGEGMPIALLEAMGAGKPLLTAKSGAIHHIIFEPENGIVLDKVTPDSVEAGLRKLLDDSDYCVATGQHNKAYAWQRFEATIVTAEIEALYAAIVAQGN